MRKGLCSRLYHCSKHSWSAPASSLLPPDTQIHTHTQEDGMFLPTFWSRGGHVTCLDVSHRQKWQCHFWAETYPPVVVFFVSFFPLWGHWSEDNSEKKHSRRVTRARWRFGALASADRELLGPWSAGPLPPQCTVLSALGYTTGLKYRNEPVGRRTA